MVVKKTYFKIISKEIKGSFGRFMAIFSIVALGVLLLSGLIVTTPDMHYTVDEYYDKYNMADVFIKGTMGLTDKDFKIISSMEEIENIMPAYVLDVMMENKKQELTATRVYGIPLISNKENASVNKLELIKGRMPRNNNECLVERKGGFISEIPIGTKLTLSKENDDYEDLEEKFHIKEYEVVGIVANTFYFSLEREVTNIGNGRLGSIIYVDDSAYNMDVYTDFYITAKGVKDLDSFTDIYESRIEEINKELKQLGERRSKVRFEEILTEATNKLNDGKKEYFDGKEEADKELSDALEDIRKGKADLAKAAIEIQDGKKELEDAKITLVEETDKAKKEIEDAKNKLSDALIELNDGEKELKDAREELYDGEIEYNDGYKKYLDSKKELEDAQKKFDKGEEKYLDGKEELADGKRQLRQGERELNDAAEKLKAAEVQYTRGLKELESKKLQFEQGVIPYLQIMNANGFNFSSANELFEAMDKDDAVKNVFNNIVKGAYKEASDGLVELELGIKTIEDNIVELESVLNVLEAIPEKSEEQIAQIEGIKYQLGVLRGKLSPLRLEREKLKAQLGQMPQDAGLFIDGYKQMKLGEIQLNEAKRQIDDGYIQIERGRREIASGWEEIEDGEKELLKAKKELEENRDKLNDGWKKLEEGKIELDDGRKKLDDGYKEIEDGRKKLDDGWKEYYDGQNELKDAEIEFEEEILKAEEKIRDGEVELEKGIREYNDGKKELEDGEIEYYKAKDDAEKELSDAWQDILKAEKDIEELEDPKWYVLDRNYNMSYASFLMNAEKVAAIAKVFPIFFYLVAALVSLTTMTRMVEEERTQIGVLKALGYTKGVIMFKYLFYSGMASALGSALGILIGLKMLPYIIWNAFSTMYHLPKFVAQFNIKIAIVSSSLAIMSTMIATYYACNNQLKEKPSVLILPRAPKAGKRILMERIKFIWSRMSFNQKATARNLFRYKKHFFMTVIGIGGCTALLLTGFGLRDSIGAVVNVQYNEILKYDVIVGLDTKEKIDLSINRILMDSKRTEEYLNIFMDKGYGIAGEERIEANIYIAKDLNELNDFIDLRERKTKESIELNENSVVITEKMSEGLGIKINDKIFIENSDEEIHEFTVTGITEQYLGNSIYIEKNNYESQFEKLKDFNTVLIKTTELSPYEQDKLISELLSTNGVISSEFTGQSKRMFENLLISINYIVLVIILASGALAFIVLYNLTNININERKKELATLKVLGFHNEEVSAYIFRETAILTLIGIVAGIIMGIALHVFIIRTIENKDFMFGRNIKLLSFILSIIITMVFSIIVNLFMSKKLKNIQMVDSMKAVD